MRLAQYTLSSTTYPQFHSKYMYHQWMQIIGRITCELIRHVTNCAPNSPSLLKLIHFYYPLIPAIEIQCIYTVLCT